MNPETCTPRNGAHPDRCPVCGEGVVDLETPGDAPGAGRNGPCPRCGHLLWFTSERVGDVVAVRLTDNRVAVMELLDLLDNAVEEGAVSRLLLDFARIQQVSSAALGKLVKLMSHAQAVRGRLKLCGLHPDLRQVFKITRLDRVFDIYETEAEALAAFGSLAH
jgi:anti-sigma B factor antagonist